jgi:hypothetical protein
VLAGRRRPLGSEDPVEDAGELGVPVPDEEAEGADPVAEVHEQVAGLLCGPCAVRVRGDLEDVHAPGRHLHDEQHVQAFEEDRVYLKEIAGEQTVSLGVQERPPRGVHVPRCRSGQLGAQDPPQH